MMDSGKRQTKLLFIAFLMMQPILDIYILFTDSVKRYTLISPATIIRVIIIAWLVIMTIMASRVSKINIRVAAIGAMLAAVYFLVHHLAVRNFPTLLPAAFQYSVVDEINYFIRYLLMFLLMWVSFRLKMTDSELDTVVTVLVLTICGSMVLTNLLHVSLIAYSESFIQSKYSFLAWFSDLWKKDPFIFNSMTSKGLFYMANPLSGVLTLLMPLNLLHYLIKGKLVNFICVILQVISAFMIGSRTAVLGCLLAMAAIFPLYLIFSFRSDKKMIMRRMPGFLMAVVVFILIYPFSPYANRPNYNLAPSTISTSQPTQQTAPAVTTTAPTPTISSSQTQSSTSASGTTQSGTAASSALTPTPTPTPKPPVYSDAMIAQLTAELSQKRIPNDFHLKIYPVKQDPEFWLKLKNLPLNQYNDSRKLEFLITDRIMIRAGTQQWLYRAFGLGRSLLANGGLYIERDYLAQVYSLGYLGFILFVMPILSLYAYCIIQIIRSKRLMNLDNLGLATAIGLILIVAYFSGHIIEELFPMLLCVALIGQLLRKVRTSHG